MWVVLIKHRVQIEEVDFVDVDFVYVLEDWIRSCDADVTWFSVALIVRKTIDARLISRTAIQAVSQIK